jgi:hypothetical protein
MFIEFAKLIRKDVGVWHKVEVLLSIPFLHPYHIKAQSVFSCDLVTLREMINLLIFIKTFVQVTFAAARTPEYIPLVAFSRSKTVIFKNRSDKLIIES